MSGSTRRGKTAAAKPAATKRPERVERAAEAPDTVFRRGHDELNVARLSLISAQSRVPSDFNTWTRSWHDGSTSITVTCTALTGHVVPHGMDNDVIVAVINAYVEDGCPEDATVRLTAHRLLLAAGLRTTSRYYKELATSLERLQSSRYVISRGWWDAGQQRFTDATFNYIWKVTRTRQNELDSRSVLAIRLPDEVALSIRQGHLKPLNIDIYRDLSTPPVRAVYRVLDALRWEGGELASQVTVNIIEWADRLNVVDREPFKVRRLLEPAHKELRERGYIKDVVITGRGPGQYLTYTFDTVGREPDPELLRELVSRGMYPVVAAQYLSDHADKEAVRKALRVFDAYPSKRNSPGALLSDILRRPEKYEGVIAPPPQAAPVRAVPLFDGPSDEDLARQAREELAALTPDARARRVEGQLKLCKVLPLLSVEEQDRLRAAVLVSVIDVNELLSRVARAVLQSPEAGADAVRAMLS
ncbi:replication initiator protein A [Deinococcus pimensis]|uniref:replication initiator protein A n=1 Tax=Deinococcus pimensis TaxID=309888 RepID=UPI0004AE6A3F|nr:replication initiator protein A [Deinococcus pimensis]